MLPSRLHAPLAVDVGGRGHDGFLLGVLGWALLPNCYRISAISCHLLPSHVHSCAMVLTDPRGG